MTQRYSSLSLLAFSLLVLAAGCLKKTNKPGASEYAGADGSPKVVETHGLLSETLNHSGPSWPVSALLKAGENPIWFELGPEGPLFIESPDAASLTPYLPWPNAQFSADMIVHNGFIIMAINRDGFLALGPYDEGKTVALYHIPSNGIWDLYTADAFFIWENKPATLIYRNDFFYEPDVPALKPQIYILDEASTIPLGTYIPALEIYPDDSLWEAEALHRGADGLWYFRFKEKGIEEGNTVYYRAADLSVSPEIISLSEWRKSELSEVPENIPPLLSYLFTNTKEWFSPDTNPVAKTISPDFDGTRFFQQTTAASIMDDDNYSGFLYAYCSENIALLMHPDGRCLYTYGTTKKISPLLLPKLPEGFVYTGIGILSDIIAASWEEQQGASIGAAGFMVMNLSDKK